MLGLFGDPHGDYSETLRVSRGDVAPFSVFLGDFDLARPLDIELSPLTQAGSEVWFVRGNHETDTVAWYDNVYSSTLAGRDFSSRVVDMGGLRVAGLGGVFRGAIWHPVLSPGEPKYLSRKDFVKRNGGNLWRGGLPRKHRSSIFPEDFDILAKQSADILVTHEAPSSHRFGFREIDRLAEHMGARLIVHGHHHEPYDGRLQNGIRVIGMGQADYRRIEL